MRPLITRVTACPATLPLPSSEGDQSRTNFPEGLSQLSGAFPEFTDPLAGTPKGGATVSAGISSRPSIRHRVLEWVGDAIGALSLFVMLWGLLWIGEILR